MLDPSGPLAELTRLPELAPFSRHINLLRADPGILNPYRVVAEPRAEHFADEDEPERAWRRERSLAAATRRRLVLDVLTGLLPYDVARLPHTRIVLLRAVREVGGAPTGTPAWSSTRCAGTPATARSTRASSPTSWRSAASCRRPRCCSRTPAGDDPWQADRDYRLTVLTMQGMTLPRPGSPREEWTDAESLAVELLNLASWLTQRTIYDADRNLRKGVALDETHFLSQVPTGKVLIDRLARDSRKFNVRALFASQLAGDLLRVSGFASLVNAVFVGRTDDERGPGRGAAAAAGADRGRLRADAGHAVAAAAARRPARRHAAAVRVRRRARRRREDPHRPRGAAPGPRARGARHEPGRQPDRRARRTRAGGGAAGPGRARPAGRGGSTSAPRPRAARSARATVPGTPPPLAAGRGRAARRRGPRPVRRPRRPGGRRRPPVAGRQRQRVRLGRCPARRAATGYHGGAVR